MTKAATSPKTVNLVSFLHESAIYNKWANERLVEWLRDKPVDILEKEVASSFPSLKLTLLHIWDVQRWWLAHLQQVPPPPVFRFEYNGTLQEIFEGLVSQSQDIADYIVSLSDEDLQDMCKFPVPVRWPEWDDFYRTRFEMLQHLVHHSSYHRGQVITIARNAGVTDPPMTDYMYYSIVVKPQLI
jgi:uncharacterized damage-inducible protein DinB